jgi:hypothetical protein
MAQGSEGLGPDFACPPGPNLAQGLWAIHRRWTITRVSWHIKTAEWPAPPWTLAPFSSSPPLSPPERASEVAGTPIDQRSDTVVRFLTGGRRSPEGERAIDEQSRCDSLSRSTLGLAPVSLGSPSQTLTRSDPVTAGPGKSWGRFFSYARVSKIWGSFHFSFDPVLIDYNPNYFLLFMQ